MQAEFAIEAMATRFELVLLGADERRVQSAGEAALEEIALVDRRWSRFRRDSLLSFLEREALARPVSLDRDDCALLATALDVHERSSGAFDVCRSGSSDDIELDRANRTIRFHRPLALDFGAIAKGHALDLARERLIEAGIEHAFLHGGTSSVSAIGRGPGGSAWRVALALSTRTVDLDGRALSVSAQRGRAHVIDRRTGEVAARTGSVSVCAPSAREADAWSTAALVLGYLPAQARGIEAIFLGEMESAA